MGVFKDPEFEAQYQALHSNIHRLDDALRGVEQRVSERPESGIAASVPGIFVVPLRLPGDGGLISVSIFYTFDGTDVTFRRLMRAP